MFLPKNRAMLITFDVLATLFTAKDPETGEGLTAPELVSETDLPLIADKHIAFTSNLHLHSGSQC